MGQIEERHSHTTKKIEGLRGILKKASDLLGDDACVYATGSFGRLEAGEQSDLDLFILTLDKRDRGNALEGSRLSGLDAICVKAELINATNNLGIPEFDGDGRYLVHYSVQDFTRTLGTPEDDVTNTFTARLLMLLESTPLLSTPVYDSALKQVLAAYFRDYQDHSNDFMPAFLSNDILRLWRTFCVNYEARTERTPEDKKKKGKLKNYKLKHSRLLTCYSSLLYLLAVYNRNNTVAPSDVVSMVGLTPLKRLEWIAQQDDYSYSINTIQYLITQYENFLVSTADEAKLADKLMDKNEGKPYFASTYEFGNTMFTALNEVGKGSRFHRLLVV